MRIGMEVARTPLPLSARSARRLATLGLAAAALALIPLPGGSPAIGQPEAQAAYYIGGGKPVQLKPLRRKARPWGRLAVRGSIKGAAASSARRRGSIRIFVRRGKRWVLSRRTRANRNGRFLACARVRVGKRHRFARLKAVTPAGASRVVRVRVNRRAPRRCGLPRPSGVVLADNGSAADPSPKWGKVDCQTNSRHKRIGGGGVGGSAFRRLTVFDGDDVWGERCELGDNWNTGKNTFYHEGMRRVTFASIRIPNNSDINNPNWRNVLQMKQAQPYTNPNPASIFELQARSGRWWVGSNWEEQWDTPASQNTWTRFAFDITYSPNPSVGNFKVYVDLNNDSDFSDSGEQSPRIFKDTLRVESGAGNPEGSAPGQAIPSTLRAGIYQNSNYGCPSGCSVDIDNVQVVKG